MKAVVVAVPGRVEVRDVPTPRPGPFEALVKVEACGLCGTTDRHIVEGRQAHHPADWYPAILGHESIGTVVELGAGVAKFKPGDRVTRPVALWPGTRDNDLYSAWGGFAEYGIVRDDAAAGRPPDYTSLRQHVVPADLTLEQGALALSLSEVASWMEKLGDVRGLNILIGGAGYAAAIMSQCARAAGARHVVVAGRSPGKFDRARRNGATETVLLGAELPALFQKLAGAKADLFLEAAGHQDVLEAGLRCLRPGGRAALYGAPEGFSYRLPLGAVGGDFSVHYLAPDDDVFFAETCRRIVAGELRPDRLLTHVWPGLDSIHEALDEQRRGRVLKGIIRL